MERDVCHREGRGHVFGSQNNDRSYSGTEISITHKCSYLDNEFLLAKLHHLRSDD